MSSWDPQRPYPDDPRASGGSGKVILLLLVLGGLTVCLLAGAGLVMWWSTTGVDEASRTLIEGPASLGRFASLEEKHAATAAAFNSESPGVGPTQLRSIRRLFDGIVAATRGSDDEAFAGQVDVQLFFLEMQNSGVMPPLGRLEERFALSSVEQGLYVPVLWDRHQIAHVRLHPDGGAAMVYGYFWDKKGGEHKVCWWIVHRDGGWKAYDWELLDYGLRASKEAAIYYTRANDRRLQQYFDCKTQLAAADGLSEQGEYQQAAETVRRTEELRILPALRDDAWLQIGNAWTRQGRADRAMACFRRVKSAEALPGAIYGQAICQSLWGRHEKALEAAARYESLLGRGPGVNRLKAESLLALGRLDEAAGELEKSLGVNPEQPDLLQALGLALAEEEKATLADYVTRIADPPQTAVSLAEQFALYGDSAALEAMGQFLATTAPDPPTQVYLAGLAKQIEGDDPAAGALFKEACGKETDAEKKGKYVNRYLEAMMAAGQPVEGYLGAPDRLAAFEYLADCYSSGEYDFPKEVFAQLVEEHRRNQPDDPWVNYYTGVLLADEEKYDEAEKQYAAGATATEDEVVLSAFRHARVAALHAAGKGMEAYKTIGPPSETFGQLAGYYRGPGRLDVQQIAELKSLVEAHRAACPDDPRLDFYAGVVAEQENDYDQADRLFARGWEQAGEEWVRSAYHERRLDARIKSGEILSALEDLPSPEATFAYLARRLSSSRKWTELGSLIEAYRRMAPASPELLLWEVELLWQQKDYAGIIRVSTPWSQRTTEQLSTWQASQLGEKLVRSCLRLKRTSEATAVAEMLYDEQGQSLPLVLVSATLGEVEKTLQLLVELLPLQYVVTSLYYDEDIGRILRSKDFLPVRRRCPPGLRFDLAGASAVILLKEARRPDAEELRGPMAGVLGAILTVTRLPADSPVGAVSSYVVTTPGQVHCVTFGGDRYRPVKDPSGPKISSPALKRAMEEHRGWVAIDAGASNYTGERTALSTVCRLAAALLEDDSLAVYLSDGGRLIPVEPATRDELQSVQWPEELSEVGEAVWLYREPDVDRSEQRAINRRRHRLRQFCSAPAGQEPGEGLLVRIQLRFGPASEFHWLAVRRVLRGGYGSMRFVGEFTADSLLAPEFRQGEPVCVESYDVIDWRHTGRQNEPAE